MAFYCVYIPPEVEDIKTMSEADRARIRFLPDTKSIYALILPPIWLIWHKLWLALAVYVLVVATILTVSANINESLGGLLSVLPGLFLLLEGNELIRRRYEREGWQFDGVIEAPDLGSTELRYFARGTGQVAPPKTEPNNATQQGSRVQLGRPSYQPSGLFPE